MRWARELRIAARAAHASSRLILWLGREAYVEASRPLVETMRHDGFAADAAVQACRLLTWATVGFGAVESGARPPSRPTTRSDREATRAASTPPRPTRCSTSTSAT